MDSSIDSHRLAVRHVREGKRLGLLESGERLLASDRLEELSHHLRPEPVIAMAPKRELMGAAIAA